MKQLLVLSLFVLGAAEHDELTKAMKTAGSTMGPLKKALDANAMADAGSAAKKLEGAFAEIEKFWKARNVADATKWSQDGAAAAKSLGAAVTANDADGAKAAFSKIGGTCKACHDVHREKLPDGSYKIK